MKTDWKVVSASSGYKSLKKAYLDYLTRWTHTPKEKMDLRKKFYGIIGYAQSEAHRLNRSLEFVLNRLEGERNCSWQSYYHSKMANKQRYVNSTTVRGYKRGVKKYRHKTPQERRELVLAFIKERDRKKSTKIPTRKRRYKV